MATVCYKACSRVSRLSETYSFCRNWPRILRLLLYVGLLFRNLTSSLIFTHRRYGKRVGARSYDAPLRVNGHLCSSIWMHMAAESHHSRAMGSISKHGDGRGYSRRRTFECLRPQILPICVQIQMDDSSESSGMKDDQKLQRQ